MSTSVWQVIVIGVSCGLGVLAGAVCFCLRRRGRSHEGTRGLGSDRAGRRRPRQRLGAALLIAIIIAAALVLVGGLIWRQLASSPGQTMRNDLSGMRTVDLDVGSTRLSVWLAVSDTDRQLGLMNVKPEEMADNQGMLFLFGSDQGGAFWMRNTLIPLDVAFVRHDGTVVNVEYMEPRSIVLHRPAEPYRYALEAKAGTLARAGLRPGDVIRLPSGLFNP